MIDLIQSSTCTLNQKFNIYRESSSICPHFTSADNVNTLKMRLHSNRRGRNNSLSSKILSYHLLNSKKETKYSLRPQTHAYILPYKDTRNFIPHFLYGDFCHGKD